MCIGDTVMEIVYRKAGFFVFSSQSIRMFLLAGVILISGCGDTSSSGESDSGNPDSTDELNAVKWGESNWDESEWE